MKKDMIIIHHSATPDGKVSKDFDILKRNHLRLGYRDIGYHYVIESVNNGYKLIVGRSEHETGAHTVGYNERGIGICLIGDFTNKEPEQGQLIVLEHTIRDIHKRRGKLPIYGHRDFNATACPGNKFPMEKVKYMVEEKQVDEYTNISAIAWDLGYRGIISEADRWIAKANADADIYWLMRKSLHYIRSNE